jgi:hypothetical protein
VRSKLRTRVHGRSALVPRRTRKSVVSDRVTAADIIAFIEQTCFAPEGKFVGQRLKLAPFQKELIGAIYVKAQSGEVLDVASKSLNMSRSIELAYQITPPKLQHSA